MVKLSRTPGLKETVHFSSRGFGQRLLTEKGRLDDDEALMAWPELQLVFFELLSL